MKYTTKDIANIFVDISANELVSGNTGSTLTSGGLPSFWSSSAWYTEDGRVSPFCEDPPSWWDEGCYS